MDDIRSNGAANHPWVDPLAGTSGYKTAGVADQDRTPLGECRHFVDRTGGIQGVVGIGNCEVGWNQLLFTRPLNKRAYNRANVDVGPDAATDSYANVIAFWKAQPYPSRRSKRSETKSGNRSP